MASSAAEGLGRDAGVEACHQLEVADGYVLVRLMSHLGGARAQDDARDAGAANARTALWVTEMMPQQTS